MTLPLAAAGTDIALVGTHLDEDIVRSVAGNGLHPRLKLTLPEQARAYRWTEFGGTLGPDTELIILGVSSAGVDWAIDRLCEALDRPIPILMVTKGMQPLEADLRPFPGYVAEQIAARTGLTPPVMAIGGPCIAGELAARRDTGVVIAGTDPDAIAHAMGLLQAPFYHARPTGDVAGTEVCAAFKNFYALGVGVTAGIMEKAEPAENGAFMNNLTASLFCQALGELAILAEAMGGLHETAYGMPGAGDLHVTCQAGRNSRMGRLLGLGLSYREAKDKHMAEDTVEGAELALSAGPTLRRMMEIGTLPAGRLPLAQAILSAICDNEPMTLPWEAFHQGLA